MKPFTKSRRGIELHLGDTEATVLRAMIENLEDSLATNEASPSLHRLFPPAYEDDSDMQAEFVGLTHDDLLAHKKAAIVRAKASLDRAKSKRGEWTVLLDEEDQQAWLGVLNDLRLFLGTRLDVTDQTFSEVPEDAEMQVYHYLGWLEEHLVECLLD